MEDGSLAAGASAAYSFRLDAGKPSEVFCASWDAGSQDWVNNTDLGPISECPACPAGEARPADCRSQRCPWPHGLLVWRLCVFGLEHSSSGRAGHSDHLAVGPAPSCPTERPPPPARVQEVQGRLGRRKANMR